VQICQQAKPKGGRNFVLRFRRLLYFSHSLIGILSESARAFHVVCVVKKAQAVCAFSWGMIMTRHYPLTTIHYPLPVVCSARDRPTKKCTFRNEPVSQCEMDLWWDQLRVPNPIGRNMKPKMVPYEFAERSHLKVSLCAIAQMAATRQPAF